LIVLIGWKPFRIWAPGLKTVVSRAGWSEVPPEFVVNKPVKFFLPDQGASKKDPISDSAAKR
jgi:hypothetical protein